MNRYEKINMRRLRRRYRVKNRLASTKRRYRIIVKKSNRYLYAQVFDHHEGKVVTGLSTANKMFQSLKSKKNLEAAKEFGEAFAKLLKEKNIEEAVFDRNGYPYHGRLKVFCETLRQNGVKI